MVIVGNWSYRWLFYSEAIPTIFPEQWTPSSSVYFIPCWFWLWDHTGVSSLVHYLLCHVTAYAFRRKFGQLASLPKKISEMYNHPNNSLWMDQTCVFEGNNSSEHTFRRAFSYKNLVDQTCEGIHMPSHGRGGSGSKLRPPCSEGQL